MVARRTLFTKFCVYHNPCSTNGGYNIGNRRLYKNSRASDWQAAIREACPHRRPLAKQHFEVQIDFYFKVAISDIDGPVKFTLDAMEGLVYKNDKQVWKLQVNKNLDRKCPRAEIRVYKLPTKHKSTRKRKR